MIPGRRVTYYTAIFVISQIVSLASLLSDSEIEGGYRKSSWEVVTTVRPIPYPGSALLATLQLESLADGYVNSWKMSLPEEFLSYTYRGDALILGVSGWGTPAVTGGGDHSLKTFKEIPGVTEKKIPGFHFPTATYRDIAFPMQHPADYEILNSQAYNRSYGAQGRVGVRFTDNFHASFIYSHNRLEGKSLNYGGFRVAPEQILAVTFGGNFQRSTNRDRVGLEFVYKHNSGFWRPYFNFLLGYDDIRNRDRIYDLKARSITVRGSGYGLVAESGLDIRLSDSVSLFTGIRFDRSFTELYEGNVKFFGAEYPMLATPYWLAQLITERSGYTILRENTFFLGAAYRVTTDGTDNHH